MNNLSIMQQALEAIEAMKAEFRALDLPYGSKAYTQANDASHSLRLAIEEAERQEPGAWAWLFRGARVDGNNVVLSTKDNDTARRLCAELLNARKKDFIDGCRSTGMDLS